MGWKQGTSPVTEQTNQDMTIEAILSRAQGTFDKYLENRDIPPNSPLGQYMSSIYSEGGSPFIVEESPVRASYNIFNDQNRAPFKNIINQLNEGEYIPGTDTIKVNIANDDYFYDDYDYDYFYHGGGYKEDEHGHKIPGRKYLDKYLPKSSHDFFAEIAHGFQLNQPKGIRDSLIRAIKSQYEFWDPVHEGVIKTVEPAGDYNLQDRYRVSGTVENLAHGTIQTALLERYYGEILKLLEPESGTTKDLHSISRQSEWLTDKLSKSISDDEWELLMNSLIDFDWASLKGTKGWDDKVRKPADAPKTPSWITDAIERMKNE